MQYFQPASKNSVVQETYAGWDTKKTFKWRVEDTHIPKWLHADAIFTSWKSNAKLGSRHPIISLSERQIDIIKQSIERFDTAEE